MFNDVYDSKKNVGTKLLNTITKKYCKNNSVRNF